MTASHKPADSNARLNNVLRNHSWLRPRQVTGRPNFSPQLDRSLIANFITKRRTRHEGLRREVATDRVRIGDETAFVATEHFVDSVFGVPSRGLEEHVLLGHDDHPDATYAASPLRLDNTTRVVHTYGCETVSLRIALTSGWQSSAEVMCQPHIVESCGL